VKPKLREHIALEVLSRLTAVVSEFANDAFESGNAAAIGALELLEEVNARLDDIAVRQPVDSAKPVGFIGAYSSTAQGEPLGIRTAADAKKTLGREPPRKDAHADLRQRHARRMVRNAEIAGEREFEATTYGDAVDGSHRRHVEQVEFIQYSPRIVEDRIELFGRGEHRICFDVSAAAEVPVSCACHDETADGCVVAYGLQVGPELGHGFGPEGIRRVRAVDHQYCDRSVPLETDILASVILIV
jgi:hypothetical protein